MTNVRIRRRSRAAARQRQSSETSIRRRRRTSSPNLSPLRRPNKTAPTENKSESKTEEIIKDILEARNQHDVINSLNLTQLRQTLKKLPISGLLIGQMNLCSNIIEKIKLRVMSLVLQQYRPLLNLSLMLLLFGGAVLTAGSYCTFNYFMDELDVISATDVTQYTNYMLGPLLLALGMFVTVLGLCILEMIAGDTIWGAFNSLMRLIGWHGMCVDTTAYPYDLGCYDCDYNKKYSP